MLVPLVALTLASAGCSTQADQPKPATTKAAVTDKATDAAASKTTSSPADQKPATPSTAAAAGDAPAAGAEKFLTAADAKAPEACQYFQAADVSKILGRTATPKEAPINLIGRDDTEGAIAIQQCMLNTSEGEVSYTVKSNPSAAAAILKKQFQEAQSSTDLKDAGATLTQVNVGEFGSVMFMEVGPMLVHKLEFATGNYTVSLMNKNKDQKKGADEMMKLAADILQKTGA